MILQSYIAIFVPKIKEAKKFMGITRKNYKITEKVPGFPGIFAGSVKMIVKFSANLLTRSLPCFGRVPAGVQWGKPGDLFRNPNRYPPLWPEPLVRNRFFTPPNCSKFFTLSGFSDSVEVSAVRRSGTSPVSHTAPSGRSSGSAPPGCGCSAPAPAPAG